MKLYEVLEKLKGSTFESLINEINTVVNGIKTNALKKQKDEFEIQLTTLKNENLSFKTEITKLENNNQRQTIDNIVKELVGNDEKKASLLKKITNIGENATDADIKKIYEKTIEENSELINFKSPDTSSNIVKETNYYDQLNSFNENTENKDVTLDKNDDVTILDNGIFDEMK